MADPWAVTSEKPIGEWDVAHVTPKASRKDSLKGGPSDMPAQGQNPTVERGFWGSVGDAITAPFNLAANLDTVTPKQVIEGLGSPIMKYLSGNPKGALGDLAGGALVGKVMGAAEAPVDGLKAGGSAVKQGAKAASTAVADVVTSPEVVKGLKRASEGAVVGSAMHGNLPGVAVGAAARIAAEKLGKYGESRRAANTPLPEAAKPVAAPVETPAPVPTVAENATVQSTPQEIAAMPPAEALKAKAAIKRSRKVKPAEQPANVVEMPSRTGEVRTIDSTTLEAPKEVFVDRARGAKAEAIAKFLHEQGATFSDVQQMLTESEPSAATAWFSEAAKQAGQKAPSLDSIKLVLSEMSKLEKKAAIVNKNPKAAAIAEELANEMTR